MWAAQEFLVRLVGNYQDFMALDTAANEQEGRGVADGSIR